MIKRGDEDPSADAEAPVASLQRLAEAESTLGSLAAALFPGGATAITQLTWPEPRGAAVGDGAPDEAADQAARLREVEARFRTLVEQIPAVTFMAVLGEGKNEIYVSPHIEALLGYSQKEWLEDPFLWYWRLHPDDRALWNDEFARGCRTGGPFKAECRFLARDGHVVWVHGEARIVKDPIGRPLFLQGVAFDITEAKRAEEILVREAVRTAKAEEELLIAQRVQTSLLPKNPMIAGLEIAAVMHPASEVGGDYYDILRTPDGCWLAIGDVSGHGLNAGLVMLMAQSALHGVLSALPDAAPSEVVALLNTVLFENVRARLTQQEHMTFSLVRYRQDGRLIFAGAHEDLVLVRRATGRAERFRTPGTWLGARSNIRRGTVDTMIELCDGDLLLLYTDGVTEARNAAGRQFDIERLCSTAEAYADAPVVEIRDRIIGAVRAWMAVQEDDITLLVLRYRSGRVSI